MKTYKFATVLAVLLALLLFSSSAFAPVSYSLDSLSVYQDDTNVLGAGTSVCTVGISGAAASCDTNLMRSTSYRFEVTISNGGNPFGEPDELKFLDVYSASDVVGSDATVSGCGCWDDSDENKSGTLSHVDNNVVCTFTTPTQCKINNGDSDVFYFILTTGSDAATGTGNFFIDETAVYNYTSSTVDFSYCMIGCDTNNPCDDLNSLTIDECVGQGACGSSCTNTPCPIACASNAACDDSNSLTVDTCSDPNTCNAACDNSACVVACGSDAACDDSNSSTLDTCSNPGACGASCSNTTIACTIACDSNSACSDSNSWTVDICSNPGTCSSSCSSSLCTVACDSDSACNDLNSLTVDTCLNSGACTSSCSYSTCDVNCSSDLACSDSNRLTIDTCVNSGSCNASCTNVPCDIDCLSDSDCNDSNPLTVDSCNNPGLCNSFCLSPECTIACSSDSDCDDSDRLTLDSCSNPGLCSASCGFVGKEQLSIEIVSDLNSAFRGQVIDLNVLVKDSNGNPVENVELSLTGPGGFEIDFNSVGNGYYSGVYSVPIDLPVGSQTFSFFAAKGEMAGLEELQLNVTAGLLKAVLVSPESLKVVPNQKLEFKFRIVFDNNTVVQNPDANAELNGISITLINDGNVFTGYYTFSEKDLDQAVLLITASDTLGNTGTTSFSFVVERPLPLELIAGAIAIIAVVLISLFVLKKKNKLFFSKGKATVSKGSVKKGSDAKALITPKKGVVKPKLSASIKKPFSALAAKIRSVLPKPKETETIMKNEADIDRADFEIDVLNEEIKNLESDFCDKKIKEDNFRQKLFDLREKIHLLELKKKKLK